MTDHATKYLIVNADDFGWTEGITRGITHAHRFGIVTSTSLMLTGKAVDLAVKLARDNPKLSVGLHFDVLGEIEQPTFDTTNVEAVREQFFKQLESFRTIMGKEPSHIDSHRGVHQYVHLVEHFKKWIEPLGLPIRAIGEVNCIASFFGKYDWPKPSPQRITAGFLHRVLKDEVQIGFNELVCHAGHYTSDYTGPYGPERDTELAVMTDPTTTEAVKRLKIKLINYYDYREVKLDLR